MNYKYYIRLNDKNEVVRAFSDAFGPVEEGDIEYGEGNNRQWSLGQLTDVETGVYLWRFDDELYMKDEETVLGEKEPILQRRRIESRLAQLDAIIPRALEDLYELTGKQPFAPKNVEVIAEKKQLRLELKQYLP